MPNLKKRAVPSSTGVKQQKQGKPKGRASASPNKRSKVAKEATPVKSRSKSPRTVPQKSQFRDVERTAPVLAGALVAGLCFFMVYSLFSLAPKVRSDACEKVGGFAWFVQGAVGDAKRTALILSECATRYDEAYPAWTLILYVSVYLLLQAFAIPGPLILSLVSGMLWPLWKAQIVIAFCATCGASMCYLLSNAIRVGDAISSLNRPRAEQFRARVREAERSGNLLYFMLFLRISPLLPNWFVNLASPGAGVPLRTFALATAVGLIPANILHYHTGKQLHELVVYSQEGDTRRNFLILLALQFLALLPTVFKSQFKERLNIG
jgi:uncharacterized membrane protein YdjX (TVP38/TMEM64 family)